MEKAEIYLLSKGVLLKSLWSEKEVGDAGSLSDVLGGQDIVLHFKVKVGPGGRVEGILNH